MKDPAVLFYYQDFLVGTEFMTDEEVGMYIRLLCHQADKGRLTKKQVLSVCKAHAIPDFVREKFECDENGLWVNKRMEQEKEKRTKYVESRRKSALGGGGIRTAYAQRMENENEDVNVNRDININGAKDKEEVEMGGNIFDEGQINRHFIGIWGRNFKGAEFKIASELIEEYGKQEFLIAMRKSQEAGIQKLNYVRGILRGMKKEKLDHEEKLRKEAERLERMKKHSNGEDNQNWSEGFLTKMITQTAEPFKDKTQTDEYKKKKKEFEDKLMKENQK